MTAPATTSELAKSYTPSEAESRILALWDEANAFHALPTPPDAPPEEAPPPYCILIPLPNVTSALHLGHALNNPLQDVLTRYHRMKGCNTLWMPGTDHAGIATQTAVEKRLMQQEGKRRTDYQRDEFVAKVQSWKDEYEATITSQLKELGCSCDWPRQRFTMDPMCARAVREAFFQLFKDGLIYRGKRLVNWDPVTLTALADDEVEMEDVKGYFWYLKYPVVDENGNDTGEFVTVATTRPETMLGDTAVAVNPNDPPRAAFVGRNVRLPIVNRIVPVIADDYVVIPDPNSDDPKAQYATGFLKVTPAHDPNDWDIGLRNNLKVINVLAPDASISLDYGWGAIEPEAADNPDVQALLGMSREDASQAVADWFQDHDLMAEVRDYEHTVGHSYRSHVPIEPYLSDQWYVKVTDDRLVGEAQRALADDQFEGVKPKREAASGVVWSSTIARDNGIERPADLELRLAAWERENRIRTCTKLEKDGGDAPHTWYVIIDETGQDDIVRYLEMSGFNRDEQAAQDPEIMALLGDAPRRGDGEVRFFPERYSKMYQAWHENLRDWCISRQLWWGHRIPVWLKYDSDFGSADQYREYQLGILRYMREDRMKPGRGLDLDEHYQLVIQNLDDDLPAYSMCVRREEDQEAIDFLESYGFVQDEDVLDTWFSSALWPLSTMGWPNPEDFPETIGLLDTFNPTSVLVTARDIVTLWVSRMVMFNRYFNDGKVPYRHVYINPMIQDGHGQRMSKSLGNGVDPRDIIHSHGADALRFVMVQMATSTQDVRVPVDMVCPHCAATFHPKEITSPAGYRVAAPHQECPQCHGKMATGYGVAIGAATPSDETPLARNTSTKFDLGRNFANKLWNAARFALANLQAAEDESIAQQLAAPELSLADRWIITRLSRTVRTVDEAIAEYQFNVYAESMYDLIWRDFCDWYLESIKPTVRESHVQQQVLRTVLSSILRLLHPICPFVTETLWPHLRATGRAGLAGIDLPDSDLITTARLPVTDPEVEDEAAVATFERLQSLVMAIRKVRAENQVPPKKKIRLLATPEVISLVDEAETIVTALAGLEAVEPITDGAGEAEAAIPLAFEGGELLLTGLVEAVDVEAEKNRQQKIIAKKEKAIMGFRNRLANPGYVNNAPAKLVEETRMQLAEAESDLATAKRALETLGAE
ncbi:MAG: valine--tRNA ligase [Phycisphaerales bacterium]|nr:MAG: valine--tRNA ligase [Phycisphaerales bacterium]